MERNQLFGTFAIYSIAGITLCLLGGILMKFNPSFADKHVAKKITLKEGLYIRETWSKLPSPYEFHAYIFNITNPDEILMGQKPILKEFGPYVYDVWQEKINLEDHEEDDTLSYTMKKTYYFNAEKSNGLTEEDGYTLVHFMYLNAANVAMRTRPTLLPFTARSIDSLFNKPESIFVNVNVKKYLWSGYEINCVGVEEYFAKVMCNDLKESWFKYRIEKIKEDFYTTSIFGTFNHTVLWAGRIRINRGIKNIADIGKFVEYNNTSNFSKWQDDKCDKFKGTDGTMFHPRLRKKEYLYATDPVLSRSFKYKYDFNFKYNGLKCHRHSASLATKLSTNPHDKCYCSSHDHCARDGVFDLWKAMNWALVASNPHFYLADPWYNNAVVGLHPQKEKHMSIMDVYPLTGAVIRAKFRVQYNAPLTQLPKYRLLKNVSEAYLPIGWFEESFIAPEKVIDGIYKIDMYTAMEKFFANSFIIMGIGIIALGIFLKYKLPKVKSMN